MRLQLRFAFVSLGVRGQFNSFSFGARLTAVRAPDAIPLCIGPIMRWYGIFVYWIFAQRSNACTRFCTWSERWLCALSVCVHCKSIDAACRTYYFHCDAVTRQNDRLITKSRAIDPNREAFNLIRREYWRWGMWAIFTLEFNVRTSCAWVAHDASIAKRITTRKFVDLWSDNRFCVSFGGHRRPAFNQMTTFAPHTHSDVLIAAIEPIYSWDNIDRSPEAVLTYFAAFEYLCSAPNQMWLLIGFIIGFVGIQLNRVTADHELKCRRKTTRSIIRFGCSRAQLNEWVTSATARPLNFCSIKRHPIAVYDNCWNSNGTLSDAAEPKPNCREYFMASHMRTRILCDFKQIAIERVHSHRVLHTIFIFISPQIDKRFNDTMNWGILK